MPGALPRPASGIVITGDRLAAVAGIYDYLPYGLGRHLWKRLLDAAPRERTGSDFLRPRWRYRDWTLSSEDVVAALSIDDRGRTIAPGWDALERMLQDLEELDVETVVFRATAKAYRADKLEDLLARPADDIARVVEHAGRVREMAILAMSAAWPLREGLARAGLCASADVD